MRQKKTSLTTRCVAEKIVLQAIDHVIWSLNVLCHFYRARGACDFSLSSGQRLVGLVHPDWERVGSDLKVSTIDLKSACKQLPLSPREYDKTVVCLKDPRSQEVACFIIHTLPFGALASVYHFLRASFLLHALKCHLGMAWGAFFDDFPDPSRRLADIKHYSQGLDLALERRALVLCEFRARQAQESTHGSLRGARHCRMRSHR